jgi:hypothetical protein
MPRPIGKNTVKIPRKKINVIKKTLYLSLKIEARYDGKSTVMQQGANSAATPAIKAETIEAPSNTFMYFLD